MSNTTDEPRRICRRLHLKETCGLRPPHRQPDAHPFRWKLLAATIAEQSPRFIRWIWSPWTGEMRIGHVLHHYQLMPGRAGGTPFSSWVRGFYFPRSRLIAIRTFFWRRQRYDEWNADSAALDQRIEAVISRLLKKQLPTVRIATGVDNAWLEKRFPGLCQW